MDVAIVGAGIGGLAAAGMLARDGHHVTLIEQSAHFDAVGAGIVMAANAVHVLNLIGVDLPQMAAPISTAELASPSQTLSSVDLTGFGPNVGPSYGVTRGALHQALADALPETVKIVLGQRIVGVERSGSRVQIGGHEVDVVVGADGVRSAIRAQMPSPSLVAANQTCWRGVVDVDLGGSMVEVWGQHGRVGLVPVENKQAYYYLVRTAEPGTAKPADIDELRRWFAGFSGVAKELLDGLGALPPLHHDFFELDRPVWGDDRILLLGDAAHAMTPNQGQGAAMALEDAVALRAALRSGVDGAAARYRALRDQRVRKVQLDSRRIGKVSHWRNPIATGIRNSTMRLAGPAGANAVKALVIPGIELVAQVA